MPLLAQKAAQAQPGGRAQKMPLLAQKAANAKPLGKGRGKGKGGELREGRDGKARNGIHVDQRAPSPLNL